MRSCRLILCERESHFAPALRRELPSQDSNLVVETRSLTGCEAALAESPESLAVIEAAVTNVTSVVDFLQLLPAKYPKCAAVVALTTDTRAFESLFNEAGAIAVCRSILETPTIARLAQRKLSTVSQSELLLPELVAQRLPWPAHAAP